MKETKTSLTYNAIITHRLDLTQIHCVYFRVEFSKMIKSASSAEGPERQVVPHHHVKIYAFSWLQLDSYFPTLALVVPSFYWLFLGTTL